MLIAISVQSRAVGRTRDCNKLWVIISSVVAQQTPGAQTGPATCVKSRELRVKLVSPDSLSASRASVPVDHPVAISDSSSCAVQLSS